MISTGIVCQIACGTQAVRPLPVIYGHVWASFVRGRLCSQNPTTKTGCEGAPWPGDGSLCRDWKERWRNVHAAIGPWIANGSYIGVMLGDEILDSGESERILLSSVENMEGNVQFAPCLG